VDDLSDLYPELVRDRGLLELLAHVTGRRARGGRLAAGYVRLVDKAVVEYQAARAALAEFERNHSSRSNARVQSHLETCIQSLNRALRFLEAMRGQGERRTDGSPLIPRPRDLAILADPVRGRIRNFRDAIEHYEEHLLKGKLPGAGSSAPYFDFESRDIVLGPHRIGASELAGWLRSAYAVAADLGNVGSDVRAFLDGAASDPVP
jgi:hypothetical protein